ncbi:Peroxidase 70 [Hordeum vulgare]|nr:Peroxidase 70 [Hordeum vulgare]
MARASIHLPPLLLLLAATCAAVANAQLSENYYGSSCPAALLTIRTTVATAVLLDRRMGASLLRLYFHDCFGCDASVLLDDTASFTGEKGAGPNAGSLRGFEVIDRIKLLLELICPRTVSCADILAAAARDAVVDNYRNRIYADTDIDGTFAASLRGDCPQGGGNDGSLAPLDASSPDYFDNSYFSGLLNHQGLLHSDQALYDGGSTDGLVRSYASNNDQFASDFAAAMVKLGNLGALTGAYGEIRVNCRVVN